MDEEAGLCSTVYPKDYSPVFIAESRFEFLKNIRKAF